MDMQDASKTVVDDDMIRLVCFMFSNEQYAVNIFNVRAVIHIPRIAPVPQMPEFTLGVINIRGSIIPVFDLRKKFGLEEKAINSQSKLLIAEVNGSQISFLIDAILDNIKIAKSSIDPSPQVKMKIKRECIQGLGQVDDRMIVILDIDRLNESINEDILELSRQGR